MKVSETTEGEREREEKNIEKGGQEEVVVIRVIHIDKVAAIINATLTLVLFALATLGNVTHIGLFLLPIASIRVTPALKIPTRMSVTVIVAICMTAFPLHPL